MNQLKPYRIETANYWMLEEPSTAGEWVALDWDNDKIPALVLQETHNCRYKYGVKGFLDKDSAIKQAIEITKQLDWNLPIRIVQVQQQNEVILVPKVDKKLTECVISNDRAANS